MKLIWLPAARRDLESIIHYIAEREANAAQRLKILIEACAERLPEHLFLLPFGFAERMMPDCIGCNPPPNFLRQ